MCLPGDQPASIRASAMILAPGICCTTTPVCELRIVAMEIPVAASTRYSNVRSEFDRLKFAAATASLISASVGGFAGRAATADADPLTVCTAGVALALCCGALLGV